MRNSINLSIFNQPLPALLAAAGFNTDVISNPTNSVSYVLDHDLSRDTRLMNVRGGIFSKIAPGCLAHIQRKYGNSDYAALQAQQGPLRGALCTFAFGGGVFEAAPDEIYITEGYSDAQAMLYWLHDKATIMPIVVEGKTAPFHNSAAHIHPAMSPAFRRENFNTLVHLMDAMERLTVLGNAVKMASGLYNGLELATGYGHDPNMHLWRTRDGFTTTRSLLEVPGLVAETNLLATAWQLVNIHTRRHAAWAA